MPHEQSSLLAGSRFSGFLDDELGKLSHLGDEKIKELNESADPDRMLQGHQNPTPLPVLSQYLTNAALFSDPLVTVDGWLVLTPGWWEAFFRPEQYPLVQLLKSRFLVSYSRSDGTLSDLAETQGAKGIRSYDAIRTAPGYGGLRRLLANYDNNDTIGFVRWPALNMDASLAAVLDDAVADLERTVQHDPTEGKRVWESLRETFEKERATSSARQAWLRSVLICTKQFALHPDMVRRLAYIGTEAYHRSRALTLGTKWGLGIGLTTVPSIGSGASALYPPNLPNGDFLSDELLVLNIDYRRITNFSKLADVLDPTTDIGALKQQFLSARGTAFENLELYQGYEDAAARYRDALNRHLGPVIETPRPKVRRAIKQFVDAAGAGAVAGVMAAAAIPLIPVTGFIAVTAGSVGAAALGALGVGFVKHYLGIGWKSLTFLQCPVQPPIGNRDPSSSLRVVRTVDTLAAQSPVVVPSQISRESILEHSNRLPAFGVASTGHAP